MSLSVRTSVLLRYLMVPHPLIDRVYNWLVLPFLRLVTNALRGLDPFSFGYLMDECVPYWSRFRALLLSQILIKGGVLPESPIGWSYEAYSSD